MNKAADRRAKARVTAKSRVKNTILTLEEQIRNIKDRTVMKTMMNPDPC